MGLKGTNSKGKYMIKLWVYMGLDECIWVSLRSFLGLDFDPLYRLYICN